MEIILFGHAPSHDTHTILYLRQGLTTSRATYFRRKKELCATRGCQCPIEWHDLSGRPYVPVTGRDAVEFRFDAKP